MARLEFGDEQPANRTNRLSECKLCVERRKCRPIDLQPPRAANVSDSTPLHFREPIWVRAEVVARRNREDLQPAHRCEPPSQNPTRAGRLSSESSKIPRRSSTPTPAPDDARSPPPECSRRWRMPAPCDSRENGSAAQQSGPRCGAPNRELPQDSLRIRSALAGSRRPDRACKDAPRAQPSSSCCDLDPVVRLTTSSAEIAV